MGGKTPGLPGNIQGESIIPWQRVLGTDITCVYTVVALHWKYHLLPGSLRHQSYASPPHRSSIFSQKKRFQGHSYLYNRALYHLHTKPNCKNHHLHPYQSLLGPISKGQVSAATQDLHCGYDASHRHRPRYPDIACPVNMVSAFSDAREDKDHGVAWCWGRCHGRVNLSSLQRHQVYRIKRRHFGLCLPKHNSVSCRFPSTQHRLANTFIIQTR